MFFFTWIFDNVITKWTFCVERSLYFSVVAIIKTRSTTIFFFSCRSSFLSLRYYDFGAFRAKGDVTQHSFATLFCMQHCTAVLRQKSLFQIVSCNITFKKHAFWRFSTQITANFFRLVFKKSARFRYNLWIEIGTAVAWRLKPSRATTV